MEQTFEVRNKTQMEEFLGSVMETFSIKIPDTEKEKYERFVRNAYLYRTKGGLEGTPWAAMLTEVILVGLKAILSVLPKKTYVYLSGEGLKEGLLIVFTDKKKPELKDWRIDKNVREGELDNFLQKMLDF
jgi:hypothetical protein